MKKAAAHLLNTLALALPLLEALTEEQAAAKPAPGKWSFKEILGHLLDSAANNHQKFVRTLAADGLQFPGYAQDVWVSAQLYNEIEWKELLLLWRHYNQHLAHIMVHIPATSIGHRLYIDEKGPFTLEFIVNDYTEHLKHHLKALLPSAPFLDSSFRMIY